MQQHLSEPFQSTPPVKAATRAYRNKDYAGFISIHAAREGGDECGSEVWLKRDISIHAAREGGDLDVNQRKRLNMISIHAAREGGDSFFHFCLYGFEDFNPRRP